VEDRWVTLSANVTENNGDLGIETLGEPLL
jgi:hypothetical protein